MLNTRSALGMFSFSLHLSKLTTVTKVILALDSHCLIVDIVLFVIGKSKAIAVWSWVLILVLIRISISDQNRLLLNLPFAEIAV